MKLRAAKGAAGGSHLDRRGDCVGELVADQLDDGSCQPLFRRGKGRIRKEPNQGRNDVIRPKGGKKTAQEAL